MHAGHSYTGSLMSDRMRAISVRSRSRRQGTTSVSTGSCAAVADPGVAMANKRLIGGRYGGGAWRSRCLGVVFPDTKVHFRPRREHRAHGSWPLHFLWDTLIPPMHPHQSLLHVGEGQGEGEDKPALETGKGGAAEVSRPSRLLVETHGSLRDCDMKKGTHMVGECGADRRFGVLRSL